MSLGPLLYIWGEVQIASHKGLLPSPMVVTAWLQPITPPVPSSLELSSPSLCLLPNTHLQGRPNTHLRGGSRAPHTCTRRPHSARSLQQPLSAEHHHCPIAAVPPLQALQGPAGGAPGAESPARRLAAAAWPRVCTCVCERVPGPSPLAASYSLKQVGAGVSSAHLLGAAAAACYVMR